MANKNGMSLFVSLMFVANFPMYLIGYISCLLCFAHLKQFTVYSSPLKTVLLINNHIRLTKMFVLCPLIFVVLFPLATKLSPGNPASGTNMTSNYELKQ